MAAPEIRLLTSGQSSYNGGLRWARLEAKSNATPRVLRPQLCCLPGFGIASNSRRARWRVRMKVWHQAA